MDLKILKESIYIYNFIFYFILFNIFQNLCVLSNIFLNLCVFPISYTCLQVISYKCKYVLFHLNMLRLFQEINMFFSLKLN
jgi:hypothetical protein